MATQAMCRVSQAAQAGELHVVRGGDDDDERVDFTYVKADKVILSNTRTVLPIMFLTS